MAAKKQAKRKNPAVDEEYEAAVQASEEFHGTPATEEFRIVTKIFEHGVLADCGELIKIEVIPIHGGPVIDIKDFGKHGARLARSPKGYPVQLFIEGGDQSVNLEDFEIYSPHELEVLGKLKYIVYYTVKHHLGRDGGEANYRHELNDAQKTIPTKARNRPTVIYDTINKLLSLAGGEYEILPEGIDN